jgi:hypothetical protein
MAIVQLWTIEKMSMYDSYDMEKTTWIFILMRVRLGTHYVAHKHFELR